MLGKHLWADLVKERYGVGVPAPAHLFSPPIPLPLHANTYRRPLQPPYLVEERDGVGVAAVLAAHAHLQSRLGVPASLHGGGHQLAHAHHVQRVEGVGLQDAQPRVGGQELGLEVLRAGRGSD